MGYFLQQTLNGIVLGSLFGLYALGFSMVFANMKVFHVAHAAIFTWGSVFAWELTANQGWSLLQAIPIVAILAGILNVLVYFIAIRHLSDRKNNELFLFVSSLGAGMILTQLALQYLDNQVVRLPLGLVEDRNWSYSGINISSVELTIIIAAAFMFIALRWLLTSTQFGREVTAVASDRDAATTLGVNASRVSILVFFISGSLAGVGATLLSLAFNVVEGYLGEHYLLIVMAVLVIGGIGSLAGGLVGGLVVGLVSAYATAYISSSFRDVIIFGLLIAFLVVRPSGIVKSVDTANRV